MYLKNYYLKLVCHSELVSESFTEIERFICKDPEINSGWQKNAK